MLIFSILLIFILINKYKKIKFLFGIFFVFIFIALIFLKPDLYNRLIQQTFKLQIYSAQTKTFHFFSTTHEAHLQTALNIFKDNPLVGTLNKSFRFLCDKEKYTYNVKKIPEGSKKSMSMGCANHPHNYYFQVLSENGVFNFFFICFFYFYLIKTIIKHMFFKYFKNKRYLNNIEVSIFIFYTVILWPIVPTGSLFSSWIASTIFLPMGYLIYNFISKKNES